MIPDSIQFSCQCWLQFGCIGVDDVEGFTRFLYWTWIAFLCCARSFLKRKTSLALSVLVEISLMMVWDLGAPNMERERRHSDSSFVDRTLVWSCAKVGDSTASGLVRVIVKARKENEGGSVWKKKRKKRNKLWENTNVKRWSVTMTKKWALVRFPIRQWHLSWHFLRGTLRRLH